MRRTAHTVLAPEDIPDGQCRDGYGDEGARYEDGYDLFLGVRKRGREGRADTNSR